MKISMYSSDDKSFPFLKGKAAELRHLGPALLDAFAHFMVPDNIQHKQVKLMLELSQKIESTLDQYAASFRFPSEVAKDFELSCWSFVQLNTSLAHFYHPQHIMLFNHTIKFHYIIHIGMISRYINPRLGWCYAGEDFMKKIKTIVQGSQHGSAPSAVVPKVMQKYAQGLGMNMHDSVWIS